VGLHVPVFPLVPEILHFLLALMEAASQTPVELQYGFLKQVLTEPAGIFPQIFLSFANLHCFVQQTPPSHSSFVFTTPFPHRLEIVLVSEWVGKAVFELDGEAVPVPVGVGVASLLFVTEDVIELVTEAGKVAEFEFVTEASKDTEFELVTELARDPPPEEAEDPLTVAFPPNELPIE